MRNRKEDTVLWQNFVPTVKMYLCIRSLLIGLIKGKCPIGRQERMGETSRGGVDSGKQRGGDARDVDKGWHTQRRGNQAM